MLSSTYENIEEATPLVAKVKKAPPTEEVHKTTFIYKVMLVVAVVAVSAIGYAVGSSSRVGNQLQTADLLASDSMLLTSNNAAEAASMNNLDEEEELPAYTEENFAVESMSMAQAQYGATAADPPDFCWKDSYPRGVGTIPKICSSGQDRIGLLCYDKCSAGYKRFGLDCHQQCPAGWDNNGLYCRRSEYGRGGGYPWKGSDGLRDTHGKMIRRCEAAQGLGNCEMYGQIAYPKCRSGYQRYGCCICRPPTPDCRALGMGKQIDLSCARQINFEGTQPKTGLCDSSEEMNAGLCYKKCRSGYKGAGPVCWASVPDGMKGCGMGAAKDKNTCATVISDQVAGPLMILATIASLGTSTAPSAAANAAKAASTTTKLGKATAAAKKAKEIYDKGKKIYDVSKATVEMGTALAENIKEGNSATVTALEATKDAMDIAALLDPTGVAATMAAFTYPKCSAYFGKPPAVETAEDVTVEVIEESEAVPYKQLDGTYCVGSEGNAFVAEHTPGCSGSNTKIVFSGFRFRTKCRYSRPAFAAVLHATCLETCNKDKDCNGFVQTATSCYYRKGPMNKCYGSSTYAKYTSYIKPK